MERFRLEGPGAVETLEQHGAHLVVDLEEPHGASSVPNLQSLRLLRDVIARWGEPQGVSLTIPPHGN